MIIRQSQHKNTRILLDNIQTLICNLRLYGIKLGDYNDCDSNALYLVLSRMQELDIDVSNYSYSVFTAPRNYGGEKIQILKVRWRYIDDSFREACAFTNDKLIEKFSKVIAKHHEK